MKKIAFMMVSLIAAFTVISCEDGKDPTKGGKETVIRADSSAGEDSAAQAISGNGSKVDTRTVNVDSLLDEYEKYINAQTKLGSEYADDAERSQAAEKLNAENKELIDSLNSCYNNGMTPEQQARYDELSVQNQQY